MGDGFFGVDGVLVTFFEVWFVLAWTPGKTLHPDKTAHTCIETMPIAIR